MPFEFGPFSISGSTVILSGSFNPSGSINLTGSMDVSGSINLTGSINLNGSFYTTSGSLIYLPFTSGSETTSSLSYLTNINPGYPFLYVINGILYYYDGSNWNQMYP